MLKFVDASKSFVNGNEPPKTIFKNLNIDIPQGSFVSILGSSGCGKTTLLRIVAGLDSLSYGELVIHSKEEKKIPPAISFVFQDPNLLPWRNVLHNVTLPLEIKKISKNIRTDKAMNILKLVGLQDASKLFPSQLSGGMKMRVSLARALVNDPELLLLDEPFAALDEITRYKLDEDLRSLWEKNKVTTLFVTHSILESAFLSERILIMSKQTCGMVYDESVHFSMPRNDDLRVDKDFIFFVQKLHEKFKSESAQGQV